MNFDLEQFFGIDSERSLVRLILSEDIVDQDFCDWLSGNDSYNFKVLLGLTPSNEKHDFVFNRLKTRLNEIVAYLCEECDIVEPAQMPMEVVLFVVSKIAGQFAFLFQAQPTWGEKDVFLDLFMDNWPLVIMFRMLLDQNIKYAKRPKSKDLRPSGAG